MQPGPQQAAVNCPQQLLLYYKAPFPGEAHLALTPPDNMHAGQGTESTEYELELASLSAAEAKAEAPTRRARRAI